MLCPRSKGASMLTELAVDDPPGADTAADWGPILRVAFRFSFAYALLYFGLSWFFELPFTSALGGAIDRGQDAIALWIGAHVLHVAQPVDRHTLGTGSGDTLLSYLGMGSQVAMRVAAAGIWSVAARRRRA